MPLFRYSPLAPALALVLLLGACLSPGASLEPTPQESDAGLPSAPATDGVEPPEESIPPEELGPFECQLPLHEQATIPIANIVDVRIGRHDGFDRVVFEFIGGTPELTLDRAEPPFTHDASGEPIQVLGESFLRLTMRGGSKQMDDGTSSYDGPTEFHPHSTTLVHLVEGGDFERQSTWYFGLTHEACVRVFLLEDEPRLVIDISDPGVGRLSGNG